MKESVGDPGRDTMYSQLLCIPHDWTIEIESHTARKLIEFWLNCDRNLARSQSWLRWRSRPKFSPNRLLRRPHRSPCLHPHREPRSPLDITRTDWKSDQNQTVTHFQSDSDQNPPQSRSITVASPWSGRNPPAIELDFGGDRVGIRSQSGQILAAIELNFCCN